MWLKVQVGVFGHLARKCWSQRWHPQYSTKWREWIHRRQIWSDNLQHSSSDGRHRGKEGSHEFPLCVRETGVLQKVSALTSVVLEESSHMVAGDCRKMVLTLRTMRFFTMKTASHVWKTMSQIWNESTWQWDYDRHKINWIPCPESTSERFIRLSTIFQSNRLEWLPTGRCLRSISISTKRWLRLTIISTPHIQHERLFSPAFPILGQNCCDNGRHFWLIIIRYAVKKRSSRQHETSINTKMHCTSPYDDCWFREISILMKSLDPLSFSLHSWFLWYFPTAQTGIHRQYQDILQNECHNRPSQASLTLIPSFTTCFVNSYISSNYSESFSCTSFRATRISSKYTQI